MSVAVLKGWQYQYLLKVFCKWPIQKGHVVKIWVGHFIDPVSESETEGPGPGSRGYGLTRT
jgi:hypothetical protein